MLTFLKRAEADDAIPVYEQSDVGEQRYAV
jgi:hypothetical protein